MLLDSHQLSHHTINGTRGLDLPTLNLLEMAKLSDINFGAYKLKLAISQQNEARLSISKHLLQILNRKFLQRVHDIMLDPFVHVDSIEIALVKLPVATSDFSIDRERGVRPV